VVGLAYMCCWNLRDEKEKEAEEEERKEKSDESEKVTEQAETSDLSRRLHDAGSGGKIG
jgi:hypothetical protein